MPLKPVCVHALDVANVCLNKCSKNYPLQIHAEEWLPDWELTLYCQHLKNPK